MPQTKKVSALICNLFQSVLISLSANRPIRPSVLKANLRQFSLKKAIVDASVLPLSIIIVGVGNAEFDAMDELDGDSVRLTAPDGRMAARDIVQFVPFRNFLRQGTSSQLSRLHLAKEVLAEIPDQFLGFMKANRIVPKPPVNNPTRIEPPDPEAMTL